MREKLQRVFRDTITLTDVPPEEQEALPALEATVMDLLEDHASAVTSWDQGPESEFQLVLRNEGDRVAHLIFLLHGSRYSASLLDVHLDIYERFTDSSPDRPLCDYRMEQESHPLVQRYDWDYLQTEKKFINETNHSITQFSLLACEHNEPQIVGKTEAISLSTLLYDAYPLSSDD